MTPKLWGRASSVNVQKVMWALAECDIAHERIDAGGKYGQTDTDAFGAMNPLRRVPVWQEGDFVLWDSHAILRHLARGPAAALWPANPQDQALVDQWIEFSTSTLQPPVIGMFYQTVRLLEPDRSAAALEKHLKALNSALDILEDRLSGREWLVGSSLSIADVALGSLFWRYYTVDIPRRDLPNVKAWYDRLGQREAYRSTVMTSYDELRGA